MEVEEVSPVAEFLGNLFYKFDLELVVPHLLTYGHILISALFPLITAGHASLSRPSSATKPPKKDDDEADSDEEEDEQSQLGKGETFEPKDALMFPLMAGSMLCALYMLLKWLKDPAILNKVLSFYVCQVGIFFVNTFVKDALVVLRSLVFPKQYRHRGKVWKADQSKRCFTACGSDSSETRSSPLPGMLGIVPLPGYFIDWLWVCRYRMYTRVKLQAHVRGIQKIKFWIGVLDIVSGVVALAATAYFTMVSKPWYLTNFIGFSFCYCTLQMMSPSTFWTGSLLLSLLFFYDVYFVFFTPMMVTVATKVDAPIKLLFPRPLSPSEAMTTLPLDPETMLPMNPEFMAPVPWLENPEEPAMKGPFLAMLGLGDIVLPGMVICMALRFDLFLYYKRKGNQKAEAEAEGKEFVAPQYQTATGGWGERFWSDSVRQSKPELEPPYHDARTFPKTYFKACIFGYIIGMIATFTAMSYFEQGQPALLYLVPGVLLSLWGTALFKGDVRDMWNFADVSDDEEDGEKKDEKSEGSASKDSKSLFARLFSGDTTLFSDFLNLSDKSSKEDKDTSKKEDSKPEEPTEAKENDNSKNGSTDKDNENGEDGKDLDLFSLSITLPQKSKPKTPRTSLGSFKPATCEEDPDDIYIRPEHDSEPPAKRVRRSPRSMDTA